MNVIGWEYLDSSTPISVLLNKDIEIQRKINTVYHPIIKGDPREKIIIGLLEGVKYRYRLNPLERIEVSDRLYNFMYDENEKLEDYCKVIYDGSNIYSLDGRKVEIINE